MATKTKKAAEKKSAATAIVQVPAPGVAGVGFNPFADAETLATVASPKKSSSKNRDEVEIDGLDKLAAFKVLEKVLESEASLVEAAVRSEVVEKYIEGMMESGRKPDSFLGTGDTSSASCEIRRRGSNMPLDDDTVKSLTAKGIPVDKKVKVPQRYVLNPEASQDALVKLAALVKKDPELSNIIKIQPEEYSFVTNEATIEMLAKSQDRQLISDMVERVATFAVGKFKIDGAEIEQKSDGAKSVTPAAKAQAIAILQKMGVLPKK